MKEKVVFFTLADWGKGTYSDSQRKLDGKAAEEIENSSIPSQGERKLDEEAAEGKNGEEGGKNNEHEQEHQEESNCPDGNELCQLQTARSMISVASEKGKPSFILALGDNFYDSGVSSTEDSMFTNNFRSIYFQESDVLKGIPWHAAIGNHDLGYGATGVSALINRTTTHSDDDEWNMPGQWYSMRYSSPYTFVVVEVILVDTTWLAPSENEATSQIDGSIQSWRIEKHVNELREIFEKSEMDPPTYRIVAGHYPIFSNGEKGDNSELVENLLPLLQEFKVSCYLSGHDHSAQHLQYLGQNFFISGHSTLTNSQISDEQNSAATLVFGNFGDAGFSRFEATSSQLKMQYIGSNDTGVIYQYSFPPLRASRLQNTAKSAGEIVLATATLAFVAMTLVQLYFARMRKTSHTQSNFISVVYTEPKLFNSEKPPTSPDDDELEF